VQPTQRPFRFGVQMNLAVSSRQQWVDAARRTEDLGYDVLTIPDHFDDQLGPLTALMCAADVTTTLRVGTTVLDNDYRHPVVLAKELATLDVLSEGRLEIGIGAGWERFDYDASGLAYDLPGRRIDRMVEAVDAMLAMFGDAPVTRHGEHYRITAHQATPRPVQRPHPPIMIGAGGPRMLAIAGERADIVIVNPILATGGQSPEVLADMTSKRFTAKIDTLRRTAELHHRDPEIAIRAFAVAVTSKTAAAAGALAATLGLTADDVLDSPFALVGSATELVATLHDRRDQFGVSYVIVPADQLDAFAPVVAALKGS
jgi:probable F420-dependent oxidoreductase